MAYQTENKLKNLIQQVGSIPEQHFRGNYNAPVLLGRVQEVLSGKLKVQRLKEQSVAQDGTITWPSGDIANAHIDIVQVYGSDAASFAVGSTVLYVPFDGHGENREKIRGTYVTVASTEAKGQYKGMVHMMVADTEDGWEFVQFIPYVP